MKDHSQHYADSWTLPWQTMEVMLSGKSAIDLDQLSIHNTSDAEEFMLAYGFDIQDKKDLKFLGGVYIQSIHFIQQHLIPKEWQKGLIPPQHVLDCKDMRQLLIWASDFSKENNQTQKWACAIIRVIHTFSHVVGVTRFMDQNKALEQMQSRVSKYIFTNKSGSLCFGEKSDFIEIEEFQWKPPKSLASMVLKLLHKKANVAETIYDLLGFRIVTKTIEDMAQVLKKLSQYHMISFPNCNPNRSRNSVMDIERFKMSLESLLEESRQNDLSSDDFHKKLSNIALTLDEGMRSVNPHSSNSYKSIQLTCRQLVTSQNKRLEWIEKLENFKLNQVDKASDQSQAETQKIIDYVLDWPELTDYRELKVFFPFEIQILHNNAYQEAISGKASHYRYKQSQVKAARKRVLGALIRESKK